MSATHAATTSGWIRAKYLAPKALSGYSDNSVVIVIMAGFDDAGVFFSDNFGSEDQTDDTSTNRLQLKNKFRDFIRQFHEGNFSYCYR